MWYNPTREEPGALLLGAHDDVGPEHGAVGLLHAHHI